MYSYAGEGNVFLLTAYGFQKSVENGTWKERRIGEPVKSYEKMVPTSWIIKGYVIKACEGLNSMCIDCAKYNNGCSGTTCQTWTGCIYRERKES